MGFRGVDFWPRILVCFGPDEMEGASQVTPGSWKRQSWLWCMEGLFLGQDLEWTGTLGGCLCLEETILGA